MTCIYLDPDALLLPASSPADDPRAGGDHRGRIAPGAREAVELLVDAGFDVFVLASDGVAPAGLPDGTRESRAVPAHLDGGAWYLTGEPYPPYDLPRGGTTMLVGPRRRDHHVPAPRFDVVSRDMPAAALEILARDAMS
jgi:hypothetical protein